MIQNPEHDAADEPLAFARRRSVPGLRHEVDHALADGEPQLHEHPPEPVRKGPGRTRHGAHRQGRRHPGQRHAGDLGLHVQQQRRRPDEGNLRGRDPGRSSFGGDLVRLVRGSHGVSGPAGRSGLLQPEPARLLSERLPGLHERRLREPRRRFDDPEGRLLLLQPRDALPEARLGGDPHAQAERDEADHEGAHEPRPDGSGVGHRRPARGQLLHDGERGGGRNGRPLHVAQGHRLVRLRLHDERRVDRYELPRPGRRPGERAVRGALPEPIRDVQPVVSSAHGAALLLVPEVRPGNLHVRSASNVCRKHHPPRRADGRLRGLREGVAHPERRGRPRGHRLHDVVDRHRARGSGYRSAPRPRRDVQRHADRELRNAGTGVRRGHPRGLGGARRGEPPPHPARGSERRGRRLPDERGPRPPFGRDRHRAGASLPELRRASPPGDHPIPHVRRALRPAVAREPLPGDHELRDRKQVLHRGPGHGRHDRRVRVDQ